MQNDFKINYLNIFKVKRYLGEGQKSVNFCKFISSVWWCSFQKNLRKPYILGGIFIGVAKFCKMVHRSSRSKFWRLSWAKNSKLFCEENWREIIWGITWEGHLNIIPATVSPISCYFLRIKIAATAWFCLNFLHCSKLYFLEISVMGGLHIYLIWAKMICFTC